MGAEHEAAYAAAAVAQALCPDAAEVLVCRHAQVEFIAPGANLDRISCPACDSPVEIDWWQERMDDASASHFARLDAVVPCCSVTISLNDLQYDWPAAFARFELEIRDPGRGWLSSAEAEQVSIVLGIEVREVLAHY